MDLERLEQRVLRCPLQELALRDETGCYVFGNDPVKPAWWYVGHQPIGGTWDFAQVRGLNNVVILVEQRYPALYTWLAHIAQGGEFACR
ncbi:MAG TPA: hypothetical protein VGT44_08035 [Ktedonobacteraceae bacterium]|nr:hypothetical protein [Ktedonobacteraceae bacterium]